MRLRARSSLPLNKTDISIYADHYAGTQLSNEVEHTNRVPLNQTDISIYADQYAGIQISNEAERTNKLTSESDRHKDLC